MSISSVAQGNSSQGDYIKAVAKYIPTEVVSIYVAVLALYDPIKRASDDAGAQLPMHLSDFGSRWVLFIAMLVATPLVTGLIFAYRAQTGAAGPDTFHWDKALYASIIGVVGLTVWVSALPDSPGWDFSWWKPGISPVLLLVFTLFTPMIAKLIGVDSFGE